MTLSIFDEREKLEKEIAELKERLSDYEKLEKFLDETLKEKLAQIEKMKCCSNCANGLRNGLLCDRQIECRKNNNKLWELLDE